MIRRSDFKDQGSPSSEKSTLQFLDAIESVFSKFKGLGLAPVYTATAMFAWLVIGGFVITKVICA